MFSKDKDYEAFEKVLAEAKEKYPMTAKKLNLESVLNPIRRPRRD